LFCIAFVIALVAAACNGGSKAATSTTSTTAKATAKTRPGDAASGDAGGGKGCATPQKASDMSATAKDLQAAGGAGPHVQAVTYPHPDYQAKLWSQWGQGVALADGRFFSAVGDHCGVNGNAYFYEFSPDSGRLRMLSDVDSSVGHNDGAWGYGKIHAQMGLGPDGKLYAATYWGASKDIAYGNGYDGDLLLRVDPGSGAITKLDVPVPKHGIPSMTTWTAGGLLYGEAPDPLAAAAADSSSTATSVKQKGSGKKAGGAADSTGSDEEGNSEAKVKPGVFFVYDIKTGKVVFQDDGTQAGYRNVAVGPKGVAYYSGGDSQLKRYDPATKKLDVLPAKLPGAYMRASTRPGPDGTIYGVTRLPDKFFALHPDGSIDVLGDAKGYTASMALDPKGDAFYYVPDAHGRSWEQGSPLIRVDTKTGDQTVVVRVNDLAEKQLQLRLGGSYDVALDPSGKRAYVGFNAGPPDSQEPFGTIVLVVIDLA
jgi:hypothetical protein